MSKPKPTRHHHMVVIFAIVLGLIPRLAFADETTAARAANVDVSAMLGDDAALRAWLTSKDNTLAASRARVAQARAEVSSASHFQNPALDAGVSNIPLGKTNPSGLGLGQTNVYSVGLSQTFELGKRGPRVDAAKLHLASAEKESLGTLADRIAAARLALAHVVYLKARQDVLVERLAAARSANGLASSRVEHGDLSGNDYDRLLLDTTLLDLEVSRASAEYGAALVDCGAAMLAPCKEPGAATILETAARLPSPIKAGADVVGAQPEVLALKLEGQAARAEKTLANRKAIPDPTFRIGYSHSQFTISGDIANTLEASLSLPITIFDHGQADAARAAAREQEALALARSLTTSTGAAIDGLVLQRTKLESGIQDLVLTALPRSKAVLNASEAAFTQGQIGMTDLLLARRADKELELHLLDLRYELFLVRNNLRRALGLDINFQR